jgi:hypothetical protein
MGVLNVEGTASQNLFSAGFFFHQKRRLVPDSSEGWETRLDRKNCVKLLSLVRGTKFGQCCINSCCKSYSKATAVYYSFKSC